MKLNLHIKRATKRSDEQIKKMVDGDIHDIFYLYANFKDAYMDHDHFLGNMTADPDLIQGERTNIGALVYKIDLKEGFARFEDFEEIDEMNRREEGTPYSVVYEIVEMMIENCYKNAEVCGVGEYFRMTGTPCLYSGSTFAVHVLWDATNGQFLTVMGDSDDAHEAAQIMADNENIRVLVERQVVQPKEKVIRAIEDDWSTQIFFMDNASNITPGEQ